MSIEVIVCNVSVGFLRHSVVLVATTLIDFEHYRSVVLASWRSMAHYCIAMVSEKDRATATGNCVKIWRSSAVWFLRYASEQPQYWAPLPHSFPAAARY